MYNEEKIRKVIEATGYTPSRTNQLPAEKSPTIGIVIPKINSESISRMVSGISQVLNQKGYRMLLADTENDVEKELQYLKSFQQDELAGIIFSATILTEEHFRLLQSMRIPVVILSQEVDGFSCIFHDDYGAAAMTEQLIQHGHKKIGAIMVTANDRAAGNDRIQALISLPFGIGSLVMGALYAPTVVTGIHHMYTIIDLGQIKEFGCTYWLPLASIASLGATGTDVTGIFGILLCLNAPVKYILMFAISAGVSFALTWMFGYQNLQTGAMAELQIENTGYTFHLAIGSAAKLSWSQGLFTLTLSEAAGFGRTHFMKKVTAIGELLIDFVPQQKGRALKEVIEFRRVAGGAPANVVTAVSKLGGRGVMISQVGEDAFGEHIRDVLQANEVNTTYVFQTKKANTGLAFVSLDASGNREFSFFRNPSADLFLSPEQITEEMLADTTGAGDSFIGSFLFQLTQA